jgi:hypothetical protein
MRAGFAGADVMSTDFPASNSTVHLSQELSDVNDGLWSVVDEQFALDKRTSADMKLRRCDNREISQS